MSTFLSFIGILAITLFLKFLYDTYYKGERYAPNGERLPSDEEIESFKYYQEFEEEKMVNSITEAFNGLSITGLSTNQKMSMINFLMIVAICDDDTEDAKTNNMDVDMESQVLNSYIDILSVRMDHCQKYQADEGFNQIFEDLKTLDLFEKELLILASYEVITCDGNPNLTELDVTASLFQKIGVSDEQYFATIEKSVLIGQRQAHKNS